MSEKLDGVRAYWDGKQFLSRQGNLFHAPDWFVEQLPTTPLDGELWLARKAFQRTVSIVRRQDKSDHWKEISFLVFDAPASSDGVRGAAGVPAQDAWPACRPGTCSFTLHEQCRGVEHLREELARVEALGGEGLMLRQPGSTVRGRPLDDAAEGEDVSRRRGARGRAPARAGRHKGRLGALGVELADGTRFSVGTGFSDAQRAKSAAVGSTITFRYQELSDAACRGFRRSCVYGLTPKRIHRGPIRRCHRPRCPRTQQGRASLLLL